MDTYWRIAELQYAVEMALRDAEYNGQSSARVQSVPDTRAIRYYTTLGILDRAAEMRGRTAFYDRRHVLQLVTIKRLQAEGMKLSEIQQKLTGLSNRKLMGIAKLSKGFWESLGKQLSKRAAKAKQAKAKSKLAAPEIHAVSEPAPQDQASAMDGSGATVSRPAKKTKANTKQRSAAAFWAEPIDVTRETPDQISADQITVRNETRIEFPSGIAISLPLSSDEVTPEIIQQLLPTVQELASRYESIQRRQNFGTHNSSNDQT